MVRLIVYIVISIVLLPACPAMALPSDEIVEYASLDEAIESELEGIDFSDLSGVSDYAICGVPSVDAECLAAFVRRFNPDFDSEIADRYVELGHIYGLRGDIAFCQAILESGWFRFDRGTAVRADQHNYCGLGVTRKGRRGASFASVRDGVAAHLQHLYAYASHKSLPKGERLLDPRFNAVRRASAVHWSDLNNRWAMNDAYGSKILKIYADLIEYKLSRLH